jgi:hypothetical protein
MSPAKKFNLAKRKLAIKLRTRKFGVRQHNSALTAESETAAIADPARLFD